MQYLTVERVMTRSVCAAHCDRACCCCAMVRVDGMHHGAQRQERVGGLRRPQQRCRPSNQKPAPHGGGVRRLEARPQGWQVRSTGVLLRATHVYRVMMYTW